ARVHEFAFERLLRREGDRMQEQVQFSELLPHALEHVGDILISCHVAGYQQRVRAERSGEFLDVFLEALALIGEGEPRPGPVPSLRDGPGDGALVSDTEYDPEFSSE